MMWVPEIRAREFPLAGKSSADILLEEAWRKKHKRDPNEHAQAALEYEAAREPQHVGLILFWIGGLLLVVMLIVAWWGATAPFPAFLLSFLVFFTGCIILLAYGEWRDLAHAASHQVVTQYLEHQWQLLKAFGKERGLLVPVVSGTLEERMKRLVVNRAFEIREFQASNSHTPNEMVAETKLKMLGNLKELYSALQKFGCVGKEGYDPYFAEAEKLSEPLVVV